MLGSGSARGHQAGVGGLLGSGIWGVKNHLPGLELGFGAGEGVTKSNTYSFTISLPLTEHGHQAGCVLSVSRASSQTSQENLGGCCLAHSCSIDEETEAREVI